MINFQWYSFSQLKSEQLYEILSLRSEVFVAEQKCVYRDVDGKDFYESFGFSTRGDVYIEAGIPHIEMLKDPTTTI